MQVKDTTPALPCPECGVPGTRNGFRQGGTQRFRCINKECSRSRYTEHTSGSVPGKPLLTEKDIPSNFDKKQSKKRKKELRAAKKGKTTLRYVITCAQNATPKFEPGWQTIQLYCKENEAELIVIPISYKNPTSVWTASQQNLQYWDESLVPYLMRERLQLCDNLVVMGDIHIIPTVENPLTGFDSITQDKSGIFGHTKVELRMVPTPQNVLPKILTTTGAITEANYTDSKAGAKGDFHHIQGACLVEVRENKKFFLRQLIMEKDGSFIDLTREYTVTGSRKAPRPKALVLGDTHVQRTDMSVTKATFVGKDSMVQMLRPEHIVYHDLVDFESRSPHEPATRFFRNYEKHMQKRDSVSEEIRNAMKYLDTYSPKWAKNIVVASNHSADHFIRWLDSGADPRHDPKNAKFFFETMAGILKDDGTFHDPLSFWAKKWLKCYDRTKFLGRDDSFLVGGKQGIELGYHGDIGAHGSRGSLKQFSKIGIRTVTGHGHAPGIEKGAFRVGTMSLMDMGYNQGSPSGWAPAHCLITGGKGSKRTLLFIIDGEW